MSGKPQVHRTGVRDVKFGERVKLVEPCNLYGCEIADDCFVGPFTEIQAGVVVGARTRVQSHAFICELVSIGEDCFIGHGVMFINDTFSTGGPARGRRELWRATKIGNRVSIGSNATIMPVSIADDVVIGAGSVVTKDIARPGTYAGNPARLLNGKELRNHVMPVPYADLWLQYQSIKDEIDGAIAAVIRDSAFIRGPYVDAFESEFAAAASAKHCVSCANGTDALYLAMAALKVKPGDEVITTAHSWISTSAMITHAGAQVVFCDTDRETFTIDPAAIEAAITPRTVGIIPVHLYGQPADMDAIMAIARRHGLWVIEDCAQAHLARYKGQMVGTFGIAASYSFYPGKNLGAMGDAGAVVTNDTALAERMTMLARHGGLVKHQHSVEGINSRLDGLQAAILSVKLRHLSRWTKARQAAARIYDSGLNQLNDLAVPHVAAGREHVYHLYTVQHPRRDDLAAYLKSHGVQTAVNYPTALPFLEAYHRFGARPEQFPNAHNHQSRILSLPMFAEITSDQQAAVVDLIHAFSRS